MPVDTASMSVRELIMELTAAEEQLRRIHLAPLTAVSRGQRRDILQQEARIIQELRHRRGPLLAHELP